MTAAEYQALTGSKAKKPLKQSQSSQKGKAPPITEVSTSSLYLAHQPYSATKQDILNQIQALRQRANEALDLVQTTEDTNEVFAFLRKLRYTEEIIQILDI